MLLKTTSLTPEVLNIVCYKGTETPFSGEYESWDKPGTYLCRQCGLALFRSSSKFHSGCGWPSFDEEIAGAHTRLPDPDGRRTEIICSRCEAHLGHVFHGENFTAKNTRHCVNSLSIDFVENLEVKDSRELLLAAGCFWGVQYYFERLNGVLKTEVGYSGGHKAHPTYREVCSGTTGHYEAIRVVFDANKLNDEAVIKYFFEIHDPSQKDGQGPDLGEQYLSVIFYYNDEQKRSAEKIIKLLAQKNIQVATKVLPAAIFWKAESDHQQYYDKTKKEPYCHRYEKKF